MTTVLDSQISEVAEALSLLDAALSHESSLAAADLLGDRETQDSLVTEFQQASALLQQFEKYCSRIAARISQQCEPGLGIHALNARYGHRNAASLIADLSRSNYAEASRLVNNGIHLLARPIESEPVTTALESGRITPAQAHAILTVIDKAQGRVDSERQQQLSAELVENGENFEVSTLRRLSEQRLLEITSKTPSEREAELRDRRYLTIGSMQDGLYLLRGLLDPESAAFLKAICDDATNPNRLLAHDGDTRIPEQLRLDRVLELLQLGVNAGPNSLYPVAKPAVKVIITAEELGNSEGKAWLEGLEVPLSKQSAERIICENGSQIVTMSSSGVVLNLGREARTFSTQQKQALIVRDGGCLWPECEKPPSWCEAHHILEWEHGGKSDLDNGVLLCRRHHMELHNQGFTIFADRTPNSTGNSPKKWCPKTPGETSGITDPKTSLKTDAKTGLRSNFSYTHSTQKTVYYWLEPPPGHPKYSSKVPMPTKAPWLSSQK